MSCPIVVWHGFGAPPCADPEPTGAARDSGLPRRGLIPVPDQLSTVKEVTVMTAFHTGQNALNNAKQDMLGQLSTQAVLSQWLALEVVSTVTPPPPPIFDNSPATTRGIALCLRPRLPVNTHLAPDNPNEKSYRACWLYTKHH